MARLCLPVPSHRVVLLGAVLGIAAALYLLAGWSVAQPPPASAPGENVADVRVVGNQTVPLERILPHIKTRAGRPYDARVVQEDVRRLNRSRMFASVTMENLREQSGGLVVIFRVVERPVLQYVKYVGLRNALETVLAEETGLKPGQPVDPYSVSEGKRKIEEWYKGKGFNLVQVTITEGSKPADRGAIYVINEGPQQQIMGFAFQGNTIVSGQRLKTQIMSGSAWFRYFGGLLDKEQIDADVKLLEKYYKNLGFLSVRIGRWLEYDETQTYCTVHFIIDEGPRCQINSINFIGITKFRPEDLLEMMKLRTGEFFDGALLVHDRTVVEQVYGSYGYVFANIKPEPRVSEDASRMDLVFVVEEGKRYRVGNINVRIEGENPHTNIRTVLNRLELRTGDVIDVRKLRRSEVRLKRSGLFNVDPTKGPLPQILVRPSELEVDEEIADSKSKAGSGTRQASAGAVRGQSPDPNAQQAVPIANPQHGPGPTANPPFAPDDQVVEMDFVGAADGGVDLYLHEALGPPAHTPNGVSQREPSNTGTGQAPPSSHGLTRPVRPWVILPHASPRRPAEEP